MSAPTNTQQRELSTIVSDVLGDLAFMVAESGASELPVGSIWLAGEVRYLGARRGTIRAWCTREFAAKLAANLLGVEPGSTEAQIRSEDSVRELLNIICGQVVTTWHGTSSVFNLTIPVIEELMTHPQRETRAGEQTCEFNVEGEPVIVTHESSD